MGNERISVLEITLGFSFVEKFFLIFGKKRDVFIELEVEDKI